MNSHLFQAGKKGGFGLVPGIAWEGNSKELKKNGADIVVVDISELGGIGEIDMWFQIHLKIRWLTPFNNRQYYATN
jgi:hypothetical protein